MPIIVAPEEPPQFRVLGSAVKQLTEQFGVDFLIPSNDGWVGIQRKTIADFFASLVDGRLQSDLLRMGELHLSILLIEGIPQWGADGSLVGASNDLFEKPKWSHTTGYKKEQFWGLLLSVQAQGTIVMWSYNTADSVRLIREVESWAAKPNHQSLLMRRKPQVATLKPTQRDWAIHLLQSFKGVGPEVAGRLYDHFGGVPLAWQVSEKELATVKGVGKVRARQLYELLERLERKEHEPQ